MFRSLKGLTCATLACTVLGLQAFAASYPEEAIKAAFLHRFAAYVHWPAAAESGPFIIAVVDADGVAAQLEQLLPGIEVRGQPAQVRRVRAPLELADVRILYVGSQSAAARALLSAAASRPILIVTDLPGGLAAGGTINFLPSERTVRFEISLTAAQRSGLRIDSALLSVAARVEGHAQGRILCGSHESASCMGDMLSVGVGP